jgi:hypothetical protein
MPFLRECIILCQRLSQIPLGFFWLVPSKWGIHQDHVNIPTFVEIFFWWSSRIPPYTYIWKCGKNGFQQSEMDKEKSLSPFDEIEEVFLPMLGRPFSFWLTELDSLVNPKSGIGV